MLTINVVALALNIMIIPTAILVIRKGFKPGKYFLAAFLVLVISVFFFILNNFGVFESEFYAAYGLQFGSAVEVILLSFAIVDKFKRFREDAFDRLVTINNMKARANVELELKVNERTEEIAAQKSVLEQQKDEILASIRYAERIQQSLLLAQQEINKLFEENFVLFKPRDIVSGEFYWFGHTHEDHPWLSGVPLRLFAAVDCTGHGVPGALMSVLAHNALDRCIQQKGVTHPAEALTFINDEIVRNLQQEKHAKSVKDGMDMVLCAYEPESRQLYFSGAKNNLYIVRNGEVIEVKGDRRSIGAELSLNANTYTLHSLQLQKGDTLYTFTDGYPDQFGGVADKKLKSRPLLKIIADLAHHPMGEQHALLGRIFELWRGENEQIDDVCMLGIRIS